MTNSVISIGAAANNTTIRSHHIKVDAFYASHMHH